MTLQPISQRDPRWANIKVGTGSQTIGQVGCFITVIAMLLGTTPDVVNDRLNAVGGYADANEVDWSKISTAFPGITCQRVFSYNNDAVKANLPCFVDVNGAPIGGTLHAVAYIGNQQCADPWTGTVKPTATYPQPLGYAILKGTWTPPADLQSQLDAMRAQRDDNWNLHLADQTTITGLQTQLSQAQAAAGKYSQLLQGLKDLLARFS